MQLLLVTVKDNAIEAFQPPSSVRARGEAIRNFQDALTSEQLRKHPGDFDLYLIGTYDDQTGLVTAEQPPIRLARGADYITNEPGQNLSDIALRAGKHFLRS